MRDQKALRDAEQFLSENQESKESQDDDFKVPEKDPSESPEQNTKADIYNLGSTAELRLSLLKCGTVSQEEKIYKSSKRGSTSTFPPDAIVKRSYGQSSTGKTCYVMVDAELQREQRILKTMESEVEKTQNSISILEKKELELEMVAKAVKGRKALLTGLKHEYAKSTIDLSTEAAELQSELSKAESNSLYTLREIKRLMSEDQTTADDLTESLVNKVLKEEQLSLFLKGGSRLKQDQKDATPVTESPDTISKRPYGLNNLGQRVT